MDICVSVVANSFQWQGRQQQLDEKFLDFVLYFHWGGNRQDAAGGPNGPLQAPGEIRPEIVSYLL